MREAFGALKVHSVQCGGPYQPSWVVLCIMGIYSYLELFGHLPKKQQFTKLDKNILYRIGITGFIHISNRLAVMVNQSF